MIMDKGQPITCPKARTETMRKRMECYTFGESVSRANYLKENMIQNYPAD
ncbi:unnamed protein product [Nezara viridula]|uniref:Uncharacterized protein n=1 Tax=Nezara viridula TaxID=85310 RepID=A0A9P0MUZ1_NEZVI|nr:unnamed protein product [Nezara viridula]